MTDHDEAVSATENGRLRSQLAIAGVLVIAAALRLWRLGDAENRSVFPSKNRGLSAP